MPAAVKHLIVTSARALPASTVASCVSAYGLDPDAAVVLTNCALLPDGTFASDVAAPESVDALVSLADDPRSWHSREVLGACFQLMKPGGAFNAASSASPANGAGAARATDTAVSALLLAGFENAAGSATVPLGVVASASARKPAWSRGAAFSLKSRRLKDRPPAGNAWRVDSLLDDDLMDEDDLLEESEFRKGADEAAAAKAAGGGCATNASACKNCSCGRAEAEAAAGETTGELSEEEKKAFKSACGNCYLGDAFRCAGCPMLGQPAGAPAGSTKVTVDLGGDDF
jgi:hypothetical protein